MVNAVDRVLVYWCRFRLADLQICILAQQDVGKGQTHVLSCTPTPRHCVECSGSRVLFKASDPCVQHSGKCRMLTLVSNSRLCDHARMHAACMQIRMWRSIARDDW